MLARSRLFGGGGLAGARSARAGGTRGPSGVPRRTLCSLHDSRDGFCPCWTGLRGVVCPACSAARALPRWRALSGPVARKAHLSAPEPRSVGRGAGDGAFGRPGVRHEGAREIKGYRRDLSRRPLGSQPSILTTKTKLRYEIRISGFCLSGSCPLDEPGLILESPSVLSGGGRTGRRACRRGLFESSSTGVGASVPWTPDQPDGHGQTGGPSLRSVERGPDAPWKHRPSAARGRRREFQLSMVAAGSSTAKPRAQAPRSEG